MTGRFIQNRISELETTKRSLLGESADPDSKGAQFYQEVLVASGFIDRAIDRLRSCVGTTSVDT